MDITFHYPPELMALLIDGVPKLCKSKKDLLLFFQGAGISKAILQPYEQLLQRDKTAFSKYHVTRELLTKLNELGEKTLRERRELLKRIVEFDDFTVCWENDQTAARGSVAAIRELVNVKDSFTRMRNEKDAEKQKRVEEQNASLAKKQAQKARQQNVKAELYALFSLTDAQKRGKALENVLNELFACHNIIVREAFTIKGQSGEGIIEQIDGLIEVDGHLYLVELKWWNKPLGTEEVAPHLVRVFNRGGQARGILISYSEFTGPAILTCREALAAGAVIVLSKLQEIVELLEREGDMKVWLKAKINAAIAEKNPMFISQK